MNKYFVRLILITITLAILLVSCKTQPSYYEVDRDFTKLNTTIKQSSDSMGGYRFATEELKINQDLYTTYYALEIQKMFNVDIQDHIQLISDLNPKERNALIFDKQKSDNLQNIYFYSLIFEDNIERIADIIPDIQKHIDELQTKSGPFSFSFKIKDELNTQGNYGERELLSTYMAIKTLNILDKNIKNKELLIDWLENQINILLNNESLFSKDSGELGSLLILMRITKELKLDLNEYFNHEKISNVLSSINRSLYDDIKNNNESIDIIYIDNVLELNKLLKNYQKLQIDLIINFLAARKHNNGAFKLNDLSSFDVLSTYLTLNVFKHNNYDIEDYAGFLDTLNKFKLINGLYLPLGETRPDVINTYYVYKIAEITNNKKVLDSVAQFCKNIASQNISTSNIIYLYDTKCLENDTTLQAVKVIERVIENELNTTSEQIRYEVVFRSLSTLKKIKGELPDVWTETIKRNILNSNFKFKGREEEIIISVYQLELLSLLNIEEKNFVQTKLDFLEEALQDILESKEQINKVNLLYFILNCFKTYDVYPNKGTLPQISEALLESKIQNGLYKSGNLPDDIPSFMSTYFALWIDFNFNNGGK